MGAGGHRHLEPGSVPLAEWRPDAEDKAEQTDSYYTMIGGVARTP